MSRFLRILRIFEYSSGWPVAGVVLIVFVSSFYCWDAAEYVIINSVYGQQAWDQGLRIVDNKGQLSDGRRLSRRHFHMHSYGSFLLLIPIFFGSAWVLSYLNFRIKTKGGVRTSQRSDAPAA